MWARLMLAGLVLLTAGCELHLEVEAAFDRDGAGRLEVAVSADEELRGRAAAAGADPLDDLAATGEQLGGGWRVSDTTSERGVRTVALSTRFAGPDAFDALAAELAAALSSPEVELLGPLRLAVTEEQLQVDGAAGLQPTDAVTEHGLTPEQAVQALQERGEVSYEVRVVLPGEVVTTNAHYRDGGTLTWTIPPGERVDLEAVGRRPPRSWWPWVVGGAVASVLLASVAAVRATRRRSGRHAAR